MRRVVVTGLGVFSPVGNSPAEAFDNLLAGKSGIDIIPEWQEQLEVHVAGRVKDFRPEDWIEPKKDIRRMDRFIQLAMAAGSQAWKNAGLPDKLDAQTGNRAGVLVGTGLMGIHALLDSYEVLKTKGPGRISPFFIPAIIANLAPGQLAIRHNLRGPNWTAVSACASGSHGIGEAFLHVRENRADIMLAGGSESALHPLAVAGFTAMHALSKNYNSEPSKASRPFDANRCGFVMGEGAGMLVLESLEHAQQRGATILAELVGYGSTSDAHHITAPSEQGEGAQRAMRAALQMASIDPSEVQYVNAHGTATHYNDISETQAIKGVFSEHAYQLVVSSTKSMTGHLLGAAGGVEAVFTVQSILQDKIPPTINLDTPDPECDLDYAPHTARDLRINAALSNSFGFGGTNASLLFQKWA